MDLQTEAQAKSRKPVLTGELQSTDLAVDAADAEASWHDDAVDLVERCRSALFGLALIGGDPLDVHFGVVGEAASLDGLGDGQVGVGQIDVLADDGDVHFVLRMVHALQQILPLVPIDIMERQAELADHIGVEAFVEQDLRHVVDARRIHAIDHAFGIHVAHQGDLVLDGLIQRTVGTQDQRIRGDAELTQHHHGMLGRLGLELMGGGDVRHQRDMHEHAVLGTQVATDLTCGLQERLGFDIAYRAADFGDDHVDIVGRLGAHTGLDLIGDMRNDLHALAEVFAGAFLAQHLLIDLTGGDIGLLAQVDVEETLVMADVEDRFPRRLR